MVSFRFDGGLPIGVIQTRGSLLNWRKIAISLTVPTFSRAHGERMFRWRAGAILEQRSQSESFRGIPLLRKERAEMGRPAVRDE
jgi:hypothetical protein